MRGWVLFHRELDPALPEVPEIFRLQQGALERGIGLEVLQPNRFDLIVGPIDGWNVRYQNRLLDKPDFIICRTGAETDYFTLALLRHFERRNIRLINGSAAIELVADKLHTMQRLLRAELPVPRSILGKFPMDPDLIERELGFPVVVKTLRGTRGAGVAKCETRDQFEELAGLLESAEARSEFLFQHYVRASHGRDVRVLVVGGQVVAAMERRSLTGSFRSNVSLGGAGYRYEPSPEMERLALDAAEALNLEVAGIDILFDEDGYRICEANSAPGFQGLEQACGIDVPGAVFAWIEGELAATAPAPAGRSEASLPGRAGLLLGSRRHLEGVGESYWEHLGFAARFGRKMIAGGLACLIHGLVPAWFTTTGSATVRSLHALVEGRGAAPAAAPVPASTIDTLAPLMFVTLWAMALPWLAGASAALAIPLSLLSLAFPLAFLMTGEAEEAEGRPPPLAGRHT